MEGESGEQVGGELESVTSAACFVQGWRSRNESLALSSAVTCPVRLASPTVR